METSALAGFLMLLERHLQHRFRSTVSPLWRSESFRILGIHPLQDGLDSPAGILLLREAHVRRISGLRRQVSDN